LPKLELKTPAKEQLAALPRHIQEELDAALLRLQANPTEEGIRLGPSLAGLWRMRVSGYRILYRVREGGVSNFSVEQLRRAEAIAPVETLQPPYSLLDREAEPEILPFCEEEGIGVIVYSPMASGLLTGKMTRERIESLPENDWRRRSEGFREPQLSRNLELVERLKRVAERHGVSPGAVAVAWTLRNPAVDGAITGFRRPEQVEPIVVAADLELSDEDAAELER
jgi:aryl-alcohol dehydrogenase-like predicted oxidoreductase